MFDNIFPEAFYITTELAIIEGAPYPLAYCILYNVFGITLFP